MILINFFDKNSLKNFSSAKNIQEAVSNVTEKIADKAEEKIKQTAADVSDKISETVANVSAEISAMEAEHKRKNLETMNVIRFNSKHLSDAQLRTFINDTSLDKFKRIGYAAAFADRYPPRKNLVDSSKS